MNFRTAYPRSHFRVSSEFPVSERMTKSEFASECDINAIMARYKKTGRLPESALAAQARFGDFSQIPSFQEMQDRVSAAYDLFAALPAQVRKEFDNDPAAFISSADTPQGRELLVKLGLGKQAVASVPETTSKVSEPVVSESVSDSVSSKKVK